MVRSFLFAALDNFNLTRKFHGLRRFRTRCACAVVAVPSRVKQATSCLNSCLSSVDKTINMIAVDNKYSQRDYTELRHVFGKSLTPLTILLLSFGCAR